MAEKKRALDIFTLLGEIDKKNYNLWDSLTEEQRKEFSPLVTMRWMAGTTDERQIVFLNEVVNLAVFSLPEHKELMLKLLTLCSSETRKRYTWINYRLSNGSKKTQRAISLIAEHYKLSMRKAEETLPLFTTEELIELAEAQGWQKEELKELQKELK